MSLEQEKNDAYRSAIEHAKKFPFDANNEGEMPVPLTLERLAAKAINLTRTLLLAEIYSSTLENFVIKPSTSTAGNSSKSSAGLLAINALFALTI